MSTSPNGATGLREGPNVPSPITRLIALGFHDGATDGVIQFGDHGPVYRFDLPQDQDEGEVVPLAERPFDLRPLPPDALDRLATVLEPHFSARWPFWFVRWHELDEQARPGLFDRINAILADAGPPAWRIITSDPWRFSTVTASRCPIRLT